MSISKELAREYAEELIQLINEEYDYCEVYENDGVRGQFPGDEDSWETIYDQMIQAKITVTWED